MKAICMGTLFAALLGLGSLVLAPVARAEIIVLQSDVDGLAGGSLLASDVVLDIPDGRTIKVILPSGATKTVKGPFAGRAGALTGGISEKSGLWSTLKELVRGGADQRKTVGAVRSLAPNAEASAPGRFSWTVVPVQARGTVCVEADSDAIELSRPHGLQTARAIVIDSKTNLRAEIRWTGNNDTTAWPDEFEPRDGGSYVILMAKQPFRLIKIVEIPKPLPGEDELLGVLYEAKCMHQLRAWLDGAINHDNR